MGRSNDGETRISLEELIYDIAMFVTRIEEGLQKHKGASLDYDTYSRSIRSITRKLRAFIKVIENGGGPKLVEQTAGVIARISENSSPTPKRDCEAIGLEEPVLQYVDMHVVYTANTPLQIDRKGLILYFDNLRKWLDTLPELSSRPEKDAGPFASNLDKVLRTIEALWVALRSIEHIQASEFNGWKGRQRAAAFRLLASATQLPRTAELESMLASMKSVQSRTNLRCYVRRHK